MLLIKDKLHCGNFIAIETYNAIFTPRGIPFYEILETDKEDASDAAVFNAVLYSV